MSENALRLPLSTRAIIGNEEAVHLIEQKERLETAAMGEDAALCLDLSKAFLETIFKTILSDRVEEPNLDKNFYPLFKDVKDILPLSENIPANELLTRLAGSIVNNVVELRNSFGAASHGGDGFHQNPIDMTSAEFVMSSVDGLAACLYKKHKETLEPDIAQRLQYNDYPEFNDWLDEQFESYTIPSTTIEFPASKMIFEHDLNSYREMLVQYSSTEEEDKEE